MRLLAQWVVSRQIFMMHILKELRVMNFAALHKVVDPQGANFGAQTSFCPCATNRVCYNCGRKGHLHYYCNEKPDPRVPRQNNSRRGSNFYGQQNRFSGNSFGNNQGN